MENLDVEVARYSTETEAQMWAGVLRSEGIPSVLVPLGVGAGGMGDTVWRPFALRVRELDVERAKSVLRNLKRNPRTRRTEPRVAPQSHTYRRR